MADISQITLPSGSTYQIKDTQARQAIETLTGSLSGALHFLGVTTSNIADGSEINPIVIDSKNVTATAGDIAIKGDKEFIFSEVDNKWHEFGDLGSLGALAFKSSATGNFTPSGNVSQPTFTGTANTGIDVSTAAGTATYTPAGTVSQPTFTGTASSGSATYTPAGGVTISTGTGTANYTPAGTVSQPSFSGTQATIAVSGGSGTATYTPAGSVSKPDVTVTPSTTTVNSITGVGTLPSLTTTVANETLTIGFSQGTLPTKGSNTTVMTGATAALAATPTFTGIGTRLTATYTPAGTVSQPTFSGSGVNLKGSFSGTEATITTSITPSGTVSKPTFSGTGVHLKTAGFTPAGTVSKPTFSGTAGTVTVE